MNTLPIRLKTEKAVLAFIQAAAVEGTRLFTLMPAGIVAGHTNVEPDLPYVVVFCGECPPHPDMPSEEGIKLATVVVHLKTHASDEERAKADTRMDELETLLTQPLDDDAPFSDENKACGRLLQALNKPVSGADPRPEELRRFHCYDAWVTGDTSANRGTVWHDQLVLQLVVQPFDSH